MREKKHPYEDILSVPRPTTHVRPPMPRQDRAAQFAPFAALTGHDAAIRETARTTQARRQLSEDEKLILDRKQQFLLEQVHQHPQVTVTYFQPDTRKAGGVYQVFTGHVRALDTFRRLFRTMEGRDIPVDDIVDLESPLFSQLEL